MVVGPSPGKDVKMCDGVEAIAISGQMTVGVINVLSHSALGAAP